MPLRSLAQMLYDRYEAQCLRHNLGVEEEKTEGHWD